MYQRQCADLKKHPWDHSDQIPSCKPLQPVPIPFDHPRFPSCCAEQAARDKTEAAAQLRARRSCSVAKQQDQEGDAGNILPRLQVGWPQAVAVAARCWHHWVSLVGFSDKNLLQWCETPTLTSKVASFTAFRDQRKYIRRSEDWWRLCKLATRPVPSPLSTQQCYLVRSHDLGKKYGTILNTKHTFKLP